MPYQTYKASYAEVENFLDVDLLISDQLDSAVLGEGVDIQGSYAKGERPITSLTLFSRHDTGTTMSVYIFSAKDIPRYTVAKLIVMSISIRVNMAYIGSLLWRNAQFIKTSFGKK